MVGSPPAPGPPAGRPLTSVTTVPSPRRPPGPRSEIRGWYENVLGWTTVPGSPVRLFTGRRFDVLEVTAEAGRAALEHLAGAGDGGGVCGGRAGEEAAGPTGERGALGGPSGERLAACVGPVLAHGGRMGFLVAAGGAEEVPGLLRWLEWGSLPLDLVAVGAGGSVVAPLPPGAVRRGTVQGAAVWLRPPVPGREESSLPAMPAPGGDEGAPGLVRLVDTLATHAHRVRLRSANAQPLAFS
ncbi:SCO3374 family protein [Streptomyces sp. 4F14]|uniref:SCO3374 family protein n=1 Tax=Streptomyces sp. 4F14 TaxID=3394380 RepID=UPI003A843707